MTLPTCEPPTRSSSEPSGALVSNPTMNSWPGRCAGVMDSTVDDTQAAAASWLGEGDAVLGVALDGALVVAAGGVAAEVPLAAGSPAHPASARAASAEVVTARRRVGRGRDVANSTRRRYVNHLRTSECLRRAARAGVESRGHAAGPELHAECSLLSTGRSSARHPP